MKYYIKDDGEGPEDACELPKDKLPFNDDLSDFAEVAAEYVFDNCDGWERNWPVVITVVNDDGSECDFSVEMEMSPNFTAYEKKEET